MNNVEIGSSSDIEINPVERETSEGHKITGIEINIPEEAHGETANLLRANEKEIENHIPLSVLAETSKGLFKSQKKATQEAKARVGKLIENMKIELALADTTGTGSLERLIAEHSKTPTNLSFKKTANTPWENEGKGAQDKVRDDNKRSQIARLNNESGNEFSRPL